MTADVTDIADDTPPRSQEPVDIARRLEAILLVVDEPQSLVALAAAVGSPVPAVRQAVAGLVADYDGETGGPRRGFELREVGGRFLEGLLKVDADRVQLSRQGLRIE